MVVTWFLQPMKSPKGLYMGLMGSASLYIIPALCSRRSVQKFDPLIDCTVTLPTQLLSDLYYAGGVSMSGTIFLFNGRERNIREFSKETGLARIIGDLPFPKFPFVFGYLPETIESPRTPSFCLIRRPRVSRVHRRMRLRCRRCSTSLPVSDGRNGYLIGGLGRAKEIGGCTHPSNGILRLLKMNYVFQSLFIKSNISFMFLPNDQIIRVLE
jgi:hypothetical protein